MFGIPAAVINRRGMRKANARCRYKMARVTRERERRRHSGLNLHKGTYLRDTFEWVE